MDKRTPSLRGEVLGADTTGPAVARVGTRVSTFRGRARVVTQEAPTTHPLTNPPPKQYNSSGAERTDQSTTAAQQYGSTHHGGTPEVRQKLRRICTFLRFSNFRGRARVVIHQAPTTTAMQQQWSNTYRPIHNGSTARTTAVHLWYARSWVGFAHSYDSPPSGGEREPSPEEAFHASRSRSWDSSAVVLRAGVGGRGTGLMCGAGVARACGR